MDDHNGAFAPTSSNQALSMFGDIDISDFGDELFDAGCWLHTSADTSKQNNVVRSNNNAATVAPLSLSGLDRATSAAAAANYFTNSSPHQEEAAAVTQQNWELAPNTPPTAQLRTSKAPENNLKDSPHFLAAAVPASSNNLSLQELGTVAGHEQQQHHQLLNTIWIAPPRSYPGSPSSSVQERLMRAIWHFQTMNKEKRLLIQIWVPIRKGVRNFLTTVEQPHLYDRASKSLLNYRTVSEKYQFSADADSMESLQGLPGRVFLGKVPEWTPDVRFFNEQEYPRVNDALMCDVRGSIALPVFERGSGNCLGVVEIVHTTQKINYRPEVESVCSALEAVDLRSSDVLTPFKKKDGSESSCNAELFEIFRIVRAVCDKHGLPLGQTWSLCTQNTKGGCWQGGGEDKAHYCASTVDSACYVRDQRVLGFHQACSEHHLSKGQGVVGHAFMTNQPCFATDLASCTKVDYPLSHHAKMFGINGSLAIRIRTANNTPAARVMDYVLELFLPFNSGIQDDPGFAFHLQVSQSISTEIQASHNFRFLEANELQLQQQQQQQQETAFFPTKDTLLLSLAGGRTKDNEEDDGKPPKTNFFIKPYQDQECSWISNIVDTQQRKGKEVAALPSPRLQKMQREEFQFTTTQWSNTEVESQRGILLADCGIGKSVDDQEYTTTSFLEGGVVDNPSFGGYLPSGTKKLGAKRKTKTPKTISLSVLRQYFAGSLKDAARSIGVCPTTLKRICRHHGIERWPSRKIKKVGHSLKKLQMVMDSVQGAQGAIPLSSFYSSFPELNSSTQNAAMVSSDPSKQQKPLPECTIFSSGSQSTSSTHTSASGHSSSTGAKTSPTLSNANTSNGDTSTAEDPAGSLKRARSETQLPMTNQESSILLERSRSNKTFPEHTCGDLPRPPPIVPVNIGNADPRARFAHKVKASFGEEKIRLTLKPDMSFGSLLQEIAKRFNIEDSDNIQIKYLDDDKEWVLLTCDDDLDECIDIQRSSCSQTIKLSVHQCTPNAGDCG